MRKANLVIESSGGRVARYSHNFERVLQIPSQSAALLTVLMLRGPQAVGELRINSERLHKFADISAVEGFLQELRGGRRGRWWCSCRACRGRARAGGRIC